MFCKDKRRIIQEIREKKEKNFAFSIFVSLFSILLGKVLNITTLNVKIENEKNPDGTTNYKAIFEVVLGALLGLTISFIILKLKHEI